MTENEITQEITAQSILQDLSDLTEAVFIENSITTEDGEKISLEDFSDLISQNVQQLADILGVALE